MVSEQSLVSLLTVVTLFCGSTCRAVIKSIQIIVHDTTTLASMLAGRQVHGFHCIATH
jgi:hypothetical protein